MTEISPGSRSAATKTRGIHSQRIRTPEGVQETWDASTAVLPSVTRDLPDLVKVRFSELSPPYPKLLQPEQIVEALNGSILGAYVSANINGPDSNGIFTGKISREEPAFRGKHRSQ